MPTSTAEVEQKHRQQELLLLEHEHLLCASALSKKLSMKRTHFTPSPSHVHSVDGNEIAESPPSPSASSDSPTLFINAKNYSETGKGKVNVLDVDITTTASSAINLNFANTATASGHPLTDFDKDDNSISSVTSASTLTDSNLPPTTQPCLMHSADCAESHELSGVTKLKNEEILVPTESGVMKAISFNETVTIGFTHSSTVYDRTSEPITPLTPHDISAILSLRFAMRRVTQSLETKRQARERAQHAWDAFIKRQCTGPPPMGTGHEAVELSVGEGLQSALAEWRTSKEFKEFEEAWKAMQMCNNEEGDEVAFQEEGVDNLMVVDVEAAKRWYKAAAAVAKVDCCDGYEKNGGVGNGMARAVSGALEEKIGADTERRVMSINNGAGGSGATFGVDRIQQERFYQKQHFSHHLHIQQQIRMQQIQQQQWLQQQQQRQMQLLPSQQWQQRQMMFSDNDSKMQAQQQYQYFYQQQQQQMQQMGQFLPHSMHPSYPANRFIQNPYHHYHHHHPHPYVQSYIQQQQQRTGVTSNAGPTIPPLVHRAPGVILSKGV